MDEAELVRCVTRAIFRATLPPGLNAELAELERRLMAALKPFAGQRMTEASVHAIAKVCREVEAQWRAECEARAVGRDVL